MVYHVQNDDEFKEYCSKAEGNGGAMIIKFSATWCGPCKVMKPVFEDLSKSYQGLFLSVDVDACPDTAAAYKVSSMPTFLFIDNGFVKAKVIGANANTLRQTAEFCLHRVG